jgi:hypothetical protein
MDRQQQEQQGENGPWPARVGGEEVLKHSIQWSLALFLGFTGV